MAVPKPVIDEAETLRREIELHNRLYHVLDTPDISDAEAGRKATHQRHSTVPVAVVEHPLNRLSKPPCPLSNAE